MVKSRADRRQANVALEITRQRRKERTRAHARGAPLLQQSQRFA